MTVPRNRPSAIGGRSSRTGFAPRARVRVVPFERMHAGSLERFFLSLSAHSRYLRFLSPVAPADRLQRLAAPASDASHDVADIIAGVNDTVDRLNGRLFTSQDYAVIARR